MTLLPLKKIVLTHMSNGIEQHHTKHRKIGEWKWVEFRFSDNKHPHGNAFKQSISVNDFSIEIPYSAITTKLNIIRSTTHSIVTVHAVYTHLFFRKYFDWCRYTQFHIKFIFSRPLHPLLLSLLFRYSCLWLASVKFKFKSRFH